METMRAVVLSEHGGPEVLRVANVERPEPGPGQVRVRIRAVALNHLDLWVRRGGPAFRHLVYPHRLGADIAGEVDAIGDGCQGVTPGEKVIVSPGTSCGSCLACLSGRDNLCRDYRILGENTQGGYAEYIVVNRVNLAPYPQRLSFEEAAACPLTFLTAWQMMVSKGKVEPGQVVLIQGAGSGVGVAAVQIAKLYGAKVIATAGSDAKLARLQDLGVDVGINYRTSDFVSVVRAETGKRGVDLVFEHVGGETFEKSLLATRTGGRIVTCGATSGFTPTLDLRHVFFRQVEILGSTMGSKGDLLTVLGHIAQGTLSPVVDRVLPLAEAAEAHRVLEGRGAFGKIVLTP